MTTRSPHIDALNKYGSVRKAADALGVRRSTFFDNLSREKKEIESIQQASAVEVENVRSSSVPRYYVMTAAVRGAKVHADFLANLEAYAKHLGARLVVGPLTNAGRQRYSEVDEGEFDDAITPYIQSAPIIVGDRVRFCPELNLTPTMVKPLQGLQTYTKRLWGIFPHTKISLETVATHKDRPTKFTATTGAVTHPHYTPTKAGYRAHFDHVHGAIILEVTRDGVWFRHVTPTNEIDGTFYDLGYKVAGGKVSWSTGVKALIYGDVHIEKVDPEVATATWGYGVARKGFTPLVEHLKPDTQIFHDLMDMHFANYHELDNLFSRLDSASDEKLTARSSFRTVFDFLRYVTKFSNANVVVDSNHDYFVEKWLLKFDPAHKGDFTNIEEYYELKSAMVRETREGRFRSILATTLDVMARGCMDAGVLQNVKFLQTDESYEIDNIECGWHGHNGPNGRRGSKTAFKFVTEKSTIGHLHSPSIESGCHVVGTSSSLDLGYNKGPSSWAPTHGIIYPHGGRTLITMSDSKFWATQGDLK